ncbi:MAG: helix-turn-helix domain-containing protein [Gemmatimonadaceae bacterium]
MAAPAREAVILAYATREHTRARIRANLVRIHRRGVLVRTHKDFANAFRTHFVDTALVEVAGDGDGHAPAELAREYPSVPFIALTPFRPVDAPAISRCAELDFADVLADGTDDGLLGHALLIHGFSTRFAAALHAPPNQLSLTTPLQLAAWRASIAHAGRPVRTAEIADALGVTREHLSRSFTAGGAPTLKRVLDLIRLLAAGELAKNPGYDLSSVARLVGFTSSAKLSATVKRVVRAHASALSALRATDLLERFLRG